MDTDCDDVGLEIGRPNRFFGATGDDDADADEGEDASWADGSFQSGTVA